MSEIAETFRLLKRERFKAGQERRATAEHDYADALRLCRGTPLMLVKKDCSLYHLRHASAGWLINLYPGNQRIYADRNRPRAPFLELTGTAWTLLDIVKAALASEES